MRPWVEKRLRAEMSEDSRFMKIALNEALKGKGKVEPNPMVGAVIIEDGEVVAKGYHEVFGGPHAERNALSALERSPRPEAVMYVTLEPCSSTGKTGPCTNAIISAGIKTVVVGAIDPNPKHRGKGVEILKSAGIDVRCGVLSEECRNINPAFNSSMEKLSDE